MSFLPYLAIWFLLVGGGGVSFLTRRATVARFVALLGPLLATVVWILARPDESAPASQVTIAGATWLTGTISWQLTGVTVLLCLIVAITDLGYRPSSVPVTHRAALALALGFWLPAAVLPFLWAGDPSSRIAALGFFILAWAAARCLLTQSGARNALKAAGGLLVSLFLLWFALVTSQAEISPASAATALASVFLLAGAWPLNRRALALRPPLYGASLLLDALPVVAAAGALVVVTGTLAVGAPQVMIVTVLALAGLMVTLVAIVRDGFAPERLRDALTPALAGLILLAGLWLGHAAIVSALRMSVFIPLMLALPFTRAVITDRVGDDAATDSAQLTTRSWSNSQVQSLAAAFFTLAGLPVTVGFATLAGLYRAWGTLDGLLLVTVTAILLGLWLGAIIICGRYAIGRVGQRPIRFVALAATALTIAGLVQVDTSLLRSSGWLAWAALAGSLMMSVALGRLLAHPDRLSATAHDAISIRRPSTGAIETWRRWRVGAAGAVADAVNALEGEQGLLVVLGFVILLLLLA